ncbi:NRDE family protein [Reichenbachiella carrageenanivorans]|uniref:NRDE family protein n=1 Tax=Reichenbachiella carrageenanivorans TaxID=2979869 RepID=A0ABY6D0T5_9BACT|nr:NRDE family protein [Reichenbachiella carrageenanivorans]UXX79718.1 NRDE family protein [Reichenbachiella carrageenanivorans]
MCLILFAWKKHPKYNLVLSANRDEFYNRPTQPAQVWPAHPSLIAGKDLTAGGTWMGITQSGRFAALTNYRDPKHINPQAPSRGSLTKDFLITNSEPEEYLHKIKSSNIPYNGFNLLVGDQDNLWYYNNINHEIISLPSGIYGLSNALLNEPWPKVKVGKERLGHILSNENLSTKDLLTLVQDQTIAPDHLLPQTGIPIEWERALSAMYITTPDYGTRCSTALIKDKTQTHFSEHSHAHLGQKEDQVDFIL